MKFVQQLAGKDAAGGTRISICIAKKNKQSKQKQQLQLYIQKRHGTSFNKMNISKPDYQNSSSGADDTKIFPADAPAEPQIYFYFYLL